MDEETCDIGYYEPIFSEIYEDNIDSVKQIIAKHPDTIDRKSSYFLSTPIYIASSNGKSEAVKLLLENKADPLIPSSGSQLPIHVACEYDKLLVLLDPKLVPPAMINQMVNTPDCCGNTVLHYVAENFQPRSAILLLEHFIQAGALPRPDRHRHFPSDLCDDKQVKECLKKHEEMYDENKTSPNSMQLEEGNERMVGTDKTEVQAAQLKSDVIATERQTCDVLKELEATKNIVKDLELKLHNERNKSQTLILQLQTRFYSSAKKMLDCDVKKGTVKWFSDQKGYGFITPDDGTADLFVHKSSIKSDGFCSLGDGEFTVEYKVEVGNDYRPKAVDVTGPGGESVQVSTRGGYGGGSCGGNHGYGGGWGGYGGGGSRGGNREYGGGYGGGGSRGGNRGYGGYRSGGRDSGCYNCGEEGHMARECSRRGGGGRRAFLKEV